MRLLSFDGLALSQFKEDINIALTFKKALVELPGVAGAFDAHGDDQVRDVLMLEYSGLVIGATSAAVDTALDAIRAKANRGNRRLIVEMRDGSERSTWAKLVKVESPTKPEDFRTQDHKLTFVAAWPWLEAEGDIWYLDTGEVLDDGLNLDGNVTTQSGAGTFSINNTGGDVVTRGLLVVKGSSTNPRIVNNTTGESIQYSGTVASGSNLVFDLGAMAVTLDGEDAYDDVTIGDNQTQFFSLATGVNSITFSGGGTLEVHWTRVY